MYQKIHFSLLTTREHKGEFRRQKNKCAVFDVPLLGSQVCFSSFKVKLDEEDALQEFHWHWRMFLLIKYSPAAHFFSQLLLQQRSPLWLLISVFQ